MEKTPNAVLFDSICETTLERQQETEALAKTSDAVVVIGDKHSSNTRKLFEIAKNIVKRPFMWNLQAKFPLKNSGIVV